MIIVMYKNDILGDGEFWRGPESDIEQIPNIPAMLTAKKVIKDGQTRSCGMWTVSQEEMKGEG